MYRPGTTPTMAASALPNCRKPARQQAELGAKRIKHSNHIRRLEIEPRPPCASPGGSAGRIRSSSGISASSHRSPGWVAEGGYDPVAELLFNAIDVDGYFLEYDTPRAGGFAPLRFVPKGKTIVLGRVTSKSGRLEGKLLGITEQFAKLRLVAEVAREVWR